MATEQATTTRMTDSGRVEAFSDGVFAIAITLLILEISVPKARTAHQLWHALGAEWPSYCAYLVSFLVIGVMWVNHHTVFSYIARVDRTLVFLNLLLLMVVAALPFPTALVAENLRTPQSAHLAVAVYGATMVAHAVTFVLFWFHVTRTGQCFDDRVDPRAARATRARFSLGLVIYPLTVLLAFISAPLALAVHGLLAVYYAFNQTPVPTVDEAAAG
ncbi:putative membrane protein [Kitasatospora sp. MAP12-15]|uniref:TMEM175 family protein n=1 Tax=unclassified Kitasatospora TaxID=2633591 RepID=UPI00247608FF|nr:TMEM175 family protein [Kitasatospora sp. MAP12-44]MDH6115007.1 putative membrane protein [Kitasatospora sp. MAP12-44]